MDTLSRMLEVVSVESARFRALEADERPSPATWLAAEAKGSSLVLLALLEGSCRVGAERLEAHAGDLVLSLGGDPLRLETTTGEGAPLRAVVGDFALGAGTARALADGLPSPTVLAAMPDAPRDEGLAALLAFGMHESSAARDRPGADSALARLAELLLVQALRRHAAGWPARGPGWLAGLRDPQVGRALALLHAEPHRAWTLNELARRAALSRSALAERFVALVGEPPMQYLTRWRLARAARALRAGAEAVTRVAERSGYESDAAFSRAFKREFGVPPARWRSGIA